MSSEDSEAQEDELLALASIYDEDEFKREESAHGGEIQICLELPPNFKIVVSAKEEQNLADGRLEYPVAFLPPLILNFELPPDYPSASAPIYTLSCKWLSRTQLTMLCKHLDKLCEENKGSVVLFTWMSFLKEESLTFLNIESPLGLKADSRRHNLNSAANVRHELEAQEESLDERAIQDVESWANVVTEILDFDQIQQQKHFNSKVYLCGICFSEKLGSECLYFLDCKHVFCKLCLKDYFEIQIKDGNVQSLNCPEPKCASVATPAQVKELVGEELFARYDRLLLQSSLDLMTDVMYCPRPSCQTAVMLEPDSSMGVCPVCRYAFCIVCKLAYHGVSPCRLSTDKLQKLCDEYVEADESTKEFLEKQYGKRRIQRALEELESSEWLETNSKPCPRCRTHIEKIDGCNKMTCTNCRQYFCWLCLNQLSGMNPYKHFSDSSSPCFNLLFQHANLDDDDNDWQW
ncbi:E3 ubiquitin-protein ligase RNF14 [Latimeria chalumnae]|uniref:E3 ubiquitin-protein ligase RNF14 n=1 Tax=Latimeria chalumnae TaxID=7897 RepID=H3AR96_LATCH|nr:PREDICTED: E3 ubiquitin-protein ligase RNF14 [Latimeria chalumnae]XP_006003269.1 PREDICTED: E3 ubiquitin-protein ligase RNF14 [Latimeria chalumnae]XP_014348325.1 PREDICTED: E3 ubiquitin-protein ligase RNF14 [Latimeria chalumnae]|eukprot:XP_006003267.1 PREDICTED: E3 ubiquitin-protein ligase RNF14 [Latimeria chalumnae]